MRYFRRAILAGILTSGSMLSAGNAPAAPDHPTTATVCIERLGDGPIITPDLDPSIGHNIQGPSLIRVPDWIENPLGKYYLYFAAHKDLYIRLAYADDIRGPWKIYKPGSVQAAESPFLTTPPPAPEEEMAKLAENWDPAYWSHDLHTEATTPHIASPDAHVDNANRRIVLYYHGLESLGRQVTRAATSPDGIHFTTRPEILGRTYMRAFQYRGRTYAIAMPGQFYHSRDGLTNFEEGPLLFNRNMRHCALLRRGHVLYVFWTQVGDAPERILLSTIALVPDWMTWKESPPVEVLRPEKQWEGADAPIKPSIRSVAYGHVNQLRDPAIFEEDGRVYLLYAVAGESGIALAEVHFEPASQPGRSDRTKGR